ncbi:hypothetical protein C8J57DRAFT_1241387 [Mycena rebaudengoi]|nr:hypothetical protein C8J57DRAFT_1241387 [Mycena rebaudengoi]
MYSSKLFPVSIAALVALFVHSPTAVSAAAVEDRAPPLCPAGQCCAGDIVGFLPSYVTAAFPAPKQSYLTTKHTFIRSTAPLFILGSVLWASWWLYAVEKAGWLYTFESRAYSHQLAHRTEPKINRHNYDPLRPPQNLTRSLRH